ncbi:hypothetical protein GRI40_08890 [Altererythrobacter aerius]|uniref:DAGKc domain-containing protein n=1 Tax=Tsuneonella aeria TaxID=1837929 RepID=A0A6I4TFD0_9SPHN|nr:diacylglycerol kinase family protein [Tsuneonella aeria]MXO75327.1 hypothetical protein [Tsuneonella aeria]
MSAMPPAPSASPKIGLIFNPRSHRNRALAGEVAGRPDVIVATPAQRGELTAVLEGFRQQGVRCIAISGGDGTVRDVLTAGLAVYEDDWPEFAVIPAGKTNALNVDLGAPNHWTLAGVIDAVARGSRIERRPMCVSDREGGGTMLGFVFGAGIFTTAVRAGQDAHRLGAFDSVAVAATAAWGVLQGLFGSDRNVWRRGAPMRVRTGADAAELPHGGQGDPDRRTFLLAATLERYPFGMKPFGDLRGLKLAVMDHPRRRVLATIPMIAFGWNGDWLREAGVHRCSTDRIELDLGDRFILDGEAFPAGSYVITPGPALRFVVP